jgi:hypothetical protein
MRMELATVRRVLHCFVLLPNPTWRMALRLHRLIAGCIILIADVQRIASNYPRQ